MPASVTLLGDAQAAGIERSERPIDRVAGRSLGRDADGVACLPGGIDGRLQLRVIHGDGIGNARANHAAAAPMCQSAPGFPAAAASQGPNSSTIW